MSKVMIEMESEQIDAIMIGELKCHIETFKKDLGQDLERGVSIFLASNHLFIKLKDLT